MAHYDLEEQEQLDALKTWWKMYGNLVTTVVTVVSVLVIVWQGWQWYQRTQAAEASAVYAVLEQALAVQDIQRVKGATGELTEKYARTTYASLAALQSARVAFDAGDLKTAKLQLQWAVEHGKNEIKDIARLRLSAVLLDEKSFEDALKALGEPESEAFAARFSALKGDVLLAQGKASEALAAYQQAQSKMQEKSGPDFELLKQKIDHLSGAV